MSAIQVLINGQPVRVENPPAHTTLLEFLRSRGLTGSKEGCAEGECGACAVAVVEPYGERTAYHVVNSCLMFLPMAADREIYTVESLAATGELRPPQRAIAAAGGSQCGYCTPGFVMSLFGEYYRPDRRGPCDTAALEGNLCRCTGYRPLRDAAHSLGAPPDDEFSLRLQRPAPVRQPFTVDGFSRPPSLDDCLDLLRIHGDAKVVAGATDLAVDANLRARRWPHLISLELISELHEFSNTPHAVTIGAALPLSEVERRWVDAPEVVTGWLSLFASPLIRRRATFGGNLATASPVGDAAPLLMALSAVVHIAGPDGRRTAPVSTFFTGYRSTVLKRGELLIAVEIPKPFPDYVRFYKVSKRPLDDISTVAAAMALGFDRDDRVRHARFAYGGVGATPVLVEAAEAAAIGHLWNSDAVDRVQRAVSRSLQPLSDHRGSREYRLAMAAGLVEKFAWERRP